MVDKYHYKLSNHLKNFHGLSLSTLHHYSVDKLIGLHENHHMGELGKNVVHEADHAFVMILDEDIAWEDQHHG